MRQRRSRKTDKPPPRRRSGQKRSGLASAEEPLQYKVVELSTVDEGALERAANEWVGRGWSLDGVQFAMRESSKRPAMAFVFFTRRGAPAEADPTAARDKLVRLAAEPARITRPPTAWERLAELAGAQTTAGTPEEQGE